MKDFLQLKNKKKKLPNKIWTKYLNKNYTKEQYHTLIDLQEQLENITQALTIIYGGTWTKNEVIFSAVHDVVKELQGE